MQLNNGSIGEASQVVQNVPWYYYQTASGSLVSSHEEWLDDREANRER